MSIWVPLGEVATVMSAFDWNQVTLGSVWSPRTITLAGVTAHPRFLRSVRAALLGCRVALAGRWRHRSRLRGGAAPRDAVLQRSFHDKDPRTARYFGNVVSHFSEPTTLALGDIGGDVHAPAGDIAPAM